MVQFQDSISDHLHHHTFSKMFFNKISKTHHVRILSCSNLRVSIWLITQPVFQAFQLSSPSFFTTFRTRLGLPHLSIANIPRCMCTHPINATSVHLLRCTQGNEHMNTHDVIHGTFVVIAKDGDFHVGWKQLHTLPSTTFHSFHQQVGIVLTKDGICTLVDVVIANPTWADLLCQSCATQGFVTFETI